MTKDIKLELLVIIPHKKGASQLHYFTTYEGNYEVTYLPILGDETKAILNSVILTQTREERLAKQQQQIGELMKNGC